MDRKIFTVFELNRYIRNLIEDDIILGGIFVRGEISNYKLHTSGHMYFTLKDERAQLSCVMFKDNASAVPFEIENGMSMTVYGSISIYEKSGQYQLYAEVLEPMGIGGLALAFEQLKAKLLSLGVFNEEHKKPLPHWPKCIGIVTSETGAAIHDIITIAKRRNKGVKLVLCPAIVQGDKAADSIAGAIEALNLYGKCNVIIVGRGGGSIEDLWAFNEEKVAYAIYNSKIPVVSAVGHETDYTIADFAADYRAATPSAAAEICVHLLEEQIDSLSELNEQLNWVIGDCVNKYKDSLLSINSGRALKRILDKVYKEQIYVEQTEKGLHKVMDRKLNLARQDLTAQLLMLEKVSPVSLMKKGYAVVRDSYGNLVKNAGSLKAQDRLEINFSDGIVYADVTDTCPNKD